MNKKLYTVNKKELKQYDFLFTFVHKYEILEQRI